MNGSSVGKTVSLALASMLTLVCPAAGRADPDWIKGQSEQERLLPRPYADPPERLWSHRFGPLGFAPGYGGSLMRDGRTLYFSMSDSSSPAKRPGALLALDLDSGKPRWRTSTAPGEHCSLNRDEHLLDCGGGPSKNRWQLVDDRNGNVLLDRTAPGAIVLGGVEHGIWYQLSRTARGAPGGNLELAWGSVRGQGPRGKAVLRLRERAPRPHDAPLVDEQLTELGGGEPWDGLIRASARGPVFFPFEISLNPSTGVARAAELPDPEPGETVVDSCEDDSAEHGSRMAIGDESNAVRIAGRTVYDRATGQALWSDPRLCQHAWISDGGGTRDGSVSAVIAVVGGYLFTEHTWTEDPDNGVAAYELRTGRLLWRHESALGTMSWFSWLTDGRRAVGLTQQRWDGGVPEDLVAVDLATGETLWRLTPPGEAGQVQKVDDKLLVTGAEAITLYG